MDDPTPHPDEVQKTAVDTGYRFAPIPEALLYSRGISDKAVRVYATLMRHGLDPQHCFPSHRRIAEFIGSAPRSIQRPIKELEDAGWIVRQPRFTDGGYRQSDGWFVRTSSAGTTQESAYDHADSRGDDHAPERDEREQLNQSKGTISASDDMQRCARCNGTYLIEHDDGSCEECDCKLRKAS